MEATQTQLPEVVRTGGPRGPRPLDEDLVTLIKQAHALTPPDGLAVTAPSLAEATTLRNRIRNTAWRMGLSARALDPSPTNDGAYRIDFQVKDRRAYTKRVAEGATVNAPPAAALTGVVTPLPGADASTQPVSAATELTATDTHTAVLPPDDVATVPPAPDPLPEPSTPDGDTAGQPAVAGESESELTTPVSPVPVPAA